MRDISGRMSTFLIAAVLAFCWTPLQAAEVSPYPPLNEDLKVENVPGSSIYYVIGSPGVPGKTNQGHTSNAGFVITPEGVVVFDALGTPSLGWALLQHIRQLTQAPVKYVVVSHYHADHIYGLQAFKDHTQAEIIAQEKSADYTNPNNTDDEAAAPRLAQRREALAPWVNETTRIVTPDSVFRDQRVLTLGGKRFVLIYGGPAHSQSDSMMLVQPDGVLFAGDIVQNGRIPFMNSADADTSRWLEALQTVAGLKPRFIIPGHGRPSDAVDSAIVFTRDYIAYLRSAMASAVQGWIPFETAYRDTDWSKYQKLPAFDATNKGNAYRVFLDMEKAAFAAGAAPKPP
jgi:glyoxylase-like metal-dependent hydrolase (beta-lactamase superfamily II)